jgi:uncharacterized protein (TIGR03435 family)
MSMRGRFAVESMVICCCAFAQTPDHRPSFDAFEVATIKPAPPEEQGRFIRMESAHRFFAKNYTLKGLVGAAYNLTPRAISGGASWTDSDKYDVLAATPGEVRPNLDEQMAMLRNLLADRFQLTFHRERKELSVYALSVAKTGSKLKESTAPPDGLPELINVITPEKEGGYRIVLPARNATMAQFASMLQRAVFDRPVVDQTSLTGKYDFDLEWHPDESQFGGNIPGNPDSSKPDLFSALQQELGLRLEATKGVVEALAIDRVEKPSDN